MSEKHFSQTTAEGTQRGNVDPKTDFSKLAQSNQSLDSQLRAAGKGDGNLHGRTKAADREMGERWCRNFGHRFRDWSDECTNGCGTKK